MNQTEFDDAAERVRMIERKERPKRKSAVLSQVAGMRVLTGSSRAVLELLLEETFWERGFAGPLSRMEIAIAINYSRAQVQRAVKQLEELGLIGILRRKQSKMYNEKNRFVVLGLTAIMTDALAPQ